MLLVRGAKSLTQRAIGGRHGKGRRVQRQGGCTRLAPSGAQRAPQRDPGQGLPTQHWVRAWETTGVLAGQACSGTEDCRRDVEGVDRLKLVGPPPGMDQVPREMGAQSGKPGDPRRGWGGGRCLTPSRAPAHSPGMASNMPFAFSANLSLHVLACSSPSSYWTVRIL